MFCGRGKREKGPILRSHGHIGILVVFRRLHEKHKLSCPSDEKIFDLSVLQWSIVKVRRGSPFSDTRDIVGKPPMSFWQTKAGFLGCLFPFGFQRLFFLS